MDSDEKLIAAYADMDLAEKWDRFCRGQKLKKKDALSGAVIMFMLSSIEKQREAMQMRMTDKAWDQIMNNDLKGAMKALGLKRNVF